MFDPNLNIWALLLYVYVLYGLGYVLGFAFDAAEDDKPGPIALFFAALVWPFFKGFNDGIE